MWQSYCRCFKYLQCHWKMFIVLSKQRKWWLCFGRQGRDNFYCGLSISVFFLFSNFLHQNIFWKKNYSSIINIQFSFRCTKEWFKNSIHLSMLTNTNVLLTPFTYFTYPAPTPIFVISILEMTFKCPHENKIYLFLKTIPLICQFIIQ